MGSFRNLPQLVSEREYQLTQKIIVVTTSAVNRQRVKTYGFTANPEKPLWENIPIALRSIPADLFLKSPLNLKCHNLCESIEPPPGYNHLLGLGLNYCIEQIHPKPNLNYTLERLKKSIRLKHWVKEMVLKEMKIIFHLYVYHRDGTRQKHLQKLKKELTSSL